MLEGFAAKGWGFGMVEWKVHRDDVAIFDLFGCCCDSGWCEEVQPADL